MASRRRSGTSPQDQFAKLPRDLLRSDAMRSLGINAWRFVHFLLIEHLGHGGKHNGKLKAPYRQLIDFGIAARHINSAIKDAEACGLVRCYRAGMRAATLYALAWLPLHDGTMPMENWRQFRDPSLEPLPTPKSRNLHHKGNAGLHHKGNADAPKLHHEGDADGKKDAENLHHKGNALYRESIPGSAVYSVSQPPSGGEQARPVGVVPLRAATAKAGAR